MKKLLKGLLITILAVSSATATTDKTFLMPRSQNANLAMEYTTYNELVQHKNGDFFGAQFQVVPFYMESSDSDNIGKYFGTNNRSNIRLGNQAAVNANPRTADFNYGYMIHDYNATAGVGTINYNPDLQAYGARIDYYQDLEMIVEGLYLKIALPIVHIENDMNIKTNVTTISGNFTAANLSNYFKGSYSNTVAAGESNAQAALEYAKIDGSQSETSVADIDFILGYKFYDNEDYYVGLNIGLTIPVGNDPDGVWVFEPIVGNGGHWALGGGFDASTKLWEDGDSNIKLTAVANYRYLFEATEKRTLGLIAPNGEKVSWGQYSLVGKLNEIRNTIQLIPAANILTKDFNIEPGSQFDSAIYFTYNNGGLTIDLGYNFFWKESEDVHLKNTWIDSEYGIAHLEVKMDEVLTFIVSNNTGVGAANGGSLGAINLLPNNTPLAPANSPTALGIDTSAAETSSVDTHKIFGSLGYIFKDWDYPVMLGFGGGYEFAGDNGIEGWQIFGKVGIKY